MLLCVYGRKTGRTSIAWLGHRGVVSSQHTRTRPCGPRASHTSIPPLPLNSHADFYPYTHTHPSINLVPEMHTHVYACTDPLLARGALPVDRLPGQHPAAGPGAGGTSLCFD